MGVAKENGRRELVAGSFLLKASLKSPGGSAPIGLHWVGGELGGIFFNGKELISKAILFVKQAKAVGRGGLCVRAGLPLPNPRTEGHFEEFRKVGRIFKLGGPFGSPQASLLAMRTHSRENPNAGTAR